MGRKFIPICLLVLSSCGPKNSLHVLEWRHGQSEESLRPLGDLEFSPSKELVSAGEKIALQQQEYQGVLIENSYVKQVRALNGEKRIVRAQVSLDSEKWKKLKLSDFQAKKEKLRKELPSVFPFFRKFPPEKIETVIAHRGTFYEPLWSIVYTDGLGIPWEMRLNNHLQVQGVKRVGSQFHDTLAMVFPLGPKKSVLQEVLLKGLQAEPTISNSKLMVGSQAAAKILSVTEPLKFNTEDARFDQVQVFFFLSESLRWFESKLGVQIPFQLKAEVHVGSPEKTNSAFYYLGKIRIGEGDGETYAHIPQDPSIVVHESVHALVETLARLPYEGEGGSLNEGFADFMTAVQLNNPHMGDVAYLKGPFRRSVVNDVKLSDRTGGLYHDSAIVSGVLWDLKERFGSEKSLQIAMYVLNRLVPRSDFADFAQSLNEAVMTEIKEPQDLLAAQSILTKRGLR